MAKHWWFSPSTVGNGVLWLVAVAMQIAGWINPGVAYLLLAAAIVWTVISIVYWSRHRTQGIAIAVTKMDTLGSYGRSNDGCLSTATVIVDITAENRGASDVQISALRCELHRRHFVFWKPPVETLSYYHIAPLDWLLIENGVPETRSVTFSRLSDSPWSFVKVQPGETLGVRMVAVFSGRQAPLVIELPKIFRKGALLSHKFLIWKGLGLD